MVCEITTPETIILRQQRAMPGFQQPKSLSGVTVIAFDPNPFLYVVSSDLAVFMIACHMHHIKK
jgi:hypothetical protein